MSWFWSFQSFLDDVVTGIQDTVERVIYDPCGPIEGVKDIIEEKQREKEYKEIERKIETGEFFEKEEEVDRGLLGEFIDACNELKNSMEEIFTVGAYEMLIKGNSEWKTSSDIMDEANEIVNEAIESYQKAYKKTQKLISALESNITVTNIKKLEVAKNINTIISVEDKNWKIKRAYMATPEFSKLNTSMPLPLPIMYSSIPTVNISKSLGFIGVPATILLTGSSSSKRIKVANENLEDAKDFMVRTKAKIVKLQEIQVRVHEVELILKEENCVLDSILNGPLNADKINEYAEQLRILLAEQVIYEDGSINMNYKSAVSKLDSVIK